MMSKEEAEVVKTVYARLMDSEEAGWSEVDENLEFFGYLTDKDLITESHVRLIKHSHGRFRCYKDHDLAHCFAPLILDAVESILKLSAESGELHPKNAYILTYYLAMSEMQMIFSD